ncbi:MAG: hypothetical protein A2Y57_01680 [Candidatus Woykebacteria bacterium RBG_13_40_7b]|uniref:Uncharacterized protein n=1 Tax=Candidatus Woykebacteria bacterium RBG_13_40_7b TaxID=1802594 RepID=A0A1G1W7A3_9BACT|nr:MAG: hypothetical protein A2Y57_01680 [Candidatus Woykebacteria bacterium RBG_13_40_7b]
MEIEKPEKLSESLISSVINESTSDALVDLSESVVDGAIESILESDTLVKVPVVGFIVGFTKGVLSFRDRMYVSKILSFLSETAKASEEDKRKYQEKLDKDPKECRKAGYVLLDLIDKVTSNEKAVMIGKVFRAFMREDFTPDKMMHLCEIIERTYLQDLKSLSNPNARKNASNLESVGIKKPIRHEEINQAIETAVEKAKMSSGIHDKYDLMRLNTNVKESGLTPEGDELRRILANY